MVIPKGTRSAIRVSALKSLHGEDSKFESSFKSRLRMVFRAWECDFRCTHAQGTRLLAPIQEITIVAIYSVNQLWVTYTTTEQVRRRDVERRIAITARQLQVR